ncbi:unnamed protein product [Ectocarpus sp. 13 AM-2016]
MTILTIIALCTDDRASEARPSSERWLCLRFCLHSEQAQHSSLVVTANSRRVRRTNEMAQRGLSATKERTSQSKREGSRTHPIEVGRHARGRNGGCYPLATNTLSLKSCPGVAKPKLGHVVGNHRTHKLFCVEIGLPLGLNELGPSVLSLILGMHYLGIAGCNASS